MPADDPPVTCLWERGSRPSPARTRGLFATALLTTLAAGCGECPTAANRGDLALAYIDFEQTLAENPPSPEQLPQLNRSFDNATIQLVSTDSQTVAARRALTPTLRPAYRPGPTHDRLTTLRVRITPQTARPDEVSPPLSPHRQLSPRRLSAIPEWREVFHPC